MRPPTTRLRPLLPHLRPLTKPPHPTLPPTRTFLPFPLPTTPTPSTSTQHITATRHLPHPPSKLYTLISDIDAYSSFLPYCLHSAVQRRDPHTHLPTLADLRIGFSAFDETFRSAVTCGATAPPPPPPPSPSSPPPHHPQITYFVEADGAGNALFTKLKTRWEVVGLHTPSPSPSRGGGGEGEGGGGSQQQEPQQSTVSLHIEVGFTSPIYAALSQAVVPKLAGTMIDAFEKRAGEVLGRERGG